MNELADRRRAAFAIAGAILAIVAVAVARLPDSLVIAIERNRPFTSDQAGWAYRLLALAAVGQAFYGGYVLLRSERVMRARSSDPKVAGMTPATIVSAVARSAAGMALLTLVYGLAAFGVTGERGGFWLFPLLVVLQGAWYFRLVGDIARWLRFQPRAPDPGSSAAMWRSEPPDYSPPLARGMRAAPEPQPTGSPGVAPS